MEVQELEKKAMEIRISALKTIFQAGYGYVGSIMSAVELMVSLYYGDLGGKRIFNLDNKKPGWDGQDYLILGKYHVIPLHYAILADLGFFHNDELNFFTKEGALLQANSSAKVPGINAPINLHGTGLSVACGLSMALKMDRKNNRVFTICGDGELQNGQVWEAAMCAAHYKLSNLILMIDKNGLQHDGSVRAIMDVDSIQAKFDAFGWNVITLTDGHNFDELLNAYARAFKTVRRPVCIVCNTVSGKGLEFIEGKQMYHSAILSESEVEMMLSKIEKRNHE